MPKFIFCIAFFSLFATLISCKKQQLSTPTLGSQIVYCDENLERLIRQHEELFKREYKYADIQLVFLQEQDLFYKLLSDSNAVIIASRKVNAQESAQLINQAVNPRHWPIGTGAIAVISNKSAKDSTVVYEDLMKYIVSKNAAENSRPLVIENAKSGIAQQLLELASAENLGGNVFALKDKESVIQYVMQNKDALGLLDWSELSDTDDMNAAKRLAFVQICAISRPKDSVQMGFLLPYQYNLQDKKYPLCRDLYVISRSGRDDVGLGFASFIAGEIGQKVILKAGLLPKYQSERAIELKDRGVRVVE